MTKGLPSPTPGAADVAKLTTSIGAALAALWFPEAALAAPFLPFAIDKFIERPKRLLIEALKNGHLEVLSNEQAAEFVPMAYRFMEAAKQGEYEHTLKVLAAFLAGELGHSIPDAGNFARMTRRLEGISHEELRVIAKIGNYLRDSREAENNAAPDRVHPKTFAAPASGNSSPEVHEMRHIMSELLSRGLLVPSGDAGQMSMGGGTYRPSPEFWMLLDRAGDSIH